MAYRLGIDVGASISLAAYLSDNEVRLLPLGDGAAALPSVAHVRADGTVSAGESAQAESLAQPAGLVDDLFGSLGTPALLEVNGRKVTGEILVARLLEVILGAAVARFGERPQRTVIAYPPGWSGTETTALMSAAGRAGLPNVTLVGADEAVAVARAVAGESEELEPAFLGAYGAAVLASKSLSDDLELTQPVPMPLVTREDLEGPLEKPLAKPPIIESVYESEGPATVFSDAEQARVDPAPIPPRPLPSVPQPPPRRSRTGWSAAIALLLAGVAVLGGILLTRNTDSTSTEVATSSTIAPVVSTSTPVATTSTTTSTSTTTTTSTSTTSTTTTTTTSTTTSTIPELAGPGLLALSGLGVVLEPGTALEANVPFGFNADAALERIVDVLGPPDIDSGWVFDEFCVVPEVRVVTIGDLELVFAGEQADGLGERSFEQWSVAGNDRRRPASLVTRLGAGVGAAVGDLQLIYGSDFQVRLDSTTGDGSGLFQLDDRGPMAGQTTGIEADSVLTSIRAGLTCQ